MGAGGSPRANTGPQSPHMGLWGAILGPGAAGGNQLGPALCLPSLLPPTHTLYELKGKPLCSISLPLPYGGGKCRLGLRTEHPSLGLAPRGPRRS